MNLLVINYEMDTDSGVLAWQARIVQELTKVCASVVVLTEKIGRYTKAENLHVELLEHRPFGLTRRFGGALLLNSQVMRLCRRHSIDTCFIHMAADWSYYLFPTFRTLKIPVVVWYAHGTVTPRLRLALACATRIVTSSPEGFRISSPKVHIIGQGIDTDLFALAAPPHPPDAAPSATRAPEARASDEQSSPGNLITVSRISRRKRIDLLLAVMAELRQIPHAPHFRLRVVGPLLTPDDMNYDRELRTYVWENELQDAVEFMGFIPQTYHPALYRSAFLHLNVSKTGSMDKTVLEALACGCPVLVSNEAFHDLLAQYPDFIISDDRPAAIAEQILTIHSRLASYSPHSLRRLVEQQHDLPSFVDKLMVQLTSAHPS